MRALPEPYRAALYYVPEAEDPLWALGSRWLGRDAASGAVLPQPLAPGIAALTEAPRRYGFHATLKAPIRPRHGLDAFVADAAALAAGIPSFELAPLAVTPLHGFLALCLARPCPPMHALADACVTQLDIHRTPEDAATQEKRAAGRPRAQREHIARWGYPLVLDAFRFHMTLTGKAEHNPLGPAAEAFFAPALAQRRRVTSIGVFVEDAPGDPFRLTHRLRLAP